MDILAERPVPSYVCQFTGIDAQMHTNPLQPIGIMDRSGNNDNRSNLHVNHNVDPQDERQTPQGLQQQQAHGQLSQNLQALPALATTSSSTLDLGLQQLLYIKLLDLQRQREQQQQQQT